MEDIKIQSSTSNNLHQTDKFECPCGKGYKSYPALFTHIKNKHNGQAPGQIKKPIQPLKRRGRPPAGKQAGLSEKQFDDKMEQQKGLTSIKTIDSSQKIEISLEHIFKIASILNQMPSYILSKERLIEVNAISQMNAYLNYSKRQQRQCQIGAILTEFFQELSVTVEWIKFEKMYILLMLLVQYISDSLTDDDIIRKGSVDLLCDFINQFIQCGVKKFTCLNGMEENCIFKQEIMVALFECFFQWLISKNYTSYKISVNQQFKPIERQYQQ